MREVQETMGYINSFLPTVFCAALGLFAVLFLVKARMDEKKDAQASAKESSNN